MKRVKIILLMMLLTIILPNNVLAESSNFDLLFSMDGDITENQIVIAVGFDGEEAMALSQTISYDSTKLSLVSVDALDNFTVTKSDETEDGKYRTLTVLADSDYSFNGSKCFTLTFEVKSKFKTNKSADVFFYNAEASGPDKIKYRHTGYVMTLKRESTSEMSSSLKLIDSSTKMEYWVVNHVYVFIIIGIFLILIVVFILVSPTRHKIENREIDSEDALKHENYQPTSKVAVDRQSYDTPTNQNVDMKDAIILNENVKPFGNVTSKPDFTNEEKLEVLNSQIDPFNITPEKTVEEAKNEVKQKEDEAHQGLTMINPVIFEEADTSNINKDVNFNNQSSNELNNNNNNSNNIVSIIILFLIVLTLGYSDIVYAEDDTTYNVDNLRNYLVGNTSSNTSLDYNKDGVVDILDLIETKNTVNCNFDELYNSDPGFAELHGKSNNLISTDPNRVTTTKKGKTSKTTTEKTTKTTTEKTTKTTKASSSSSSGGSSSNSTTKKTTTAKTTTTKASYTVNLSVVNGSASENSFTITSGEKHSVTFSINDGYELNSSSVSCDNISYTVSSKNGTVSFSSPKGNSTCTITMQPKDDVKVTFKTLKGSYSSSTGNITYGTYKTAKSVTSTYGSTATYEVSTPDGYQVASSSPDCGTYANGVWSVTVPTSSITCTLKFDPIKYSVSLEGNNIGSIYYGESKKFTYSAEIKYSKVSCNGKTISLNRSSGTGDYNVSYTYTFTYKQSTTSNVVCTFVI